jgi:hypothetical protein
MNARMGRVPARNDKSPAAIAAHRALGRRGYMNRSARRAEQRSHDRQWQVALALMDERRGALARLAQAD